MLYIILKRKSWSIHWKYNFSMDNNILLSFYGLFVKHRFSLVEIKWDKISLIPKYAKFYVHHEYLSRFMLIMLLWKDTLKALLSEKNYCAMNSFFWFFSKTILIFGFSVFEFTKQDFKVFDEKKIWITINQKNA